MASENEGQINRKSVTDEEDGDNCDLFENTSTFGIGLTSENNSGDEKESLKCPNCLKDYTAPRVLSCLHVFCEQCVIQFVRAEISREKQSNDNHCDQLKLPGIIQCPSCKQETMLGKQGPCSLPLDPVIKNKLNRDGTKAASSQLRCTSCKNKEKAIAKCLDCNNYLCDKCYSFHQYLRCFENHKVLSIEAFTDGAVFEEPEYPGCDQHPTEQIRFYCNTCQVPACTLCLGSFHAGSGHSTERLREVESCCRAELERLCNLASTSQSDCHSSANKLETGFVELQTQYDAAREAIEAAHQVYLAKLSEKRDEVLKELNTVHKNSELKIMEASYRMERIRDHMEYVVGYTRKLLQLTNPVHILSIQQLVKVQLEKLLSDTHVPEDTNISITFQADLPKFTEILNSLYGKISAQVFPTASGLYEILTPSQTPLPATSTSQSIFSLQTNDYSKLCQGENSDVMLGNLARIIPSNFPKQLNLKQSQMLAEQQFPAEVSPLEWPIKNRNLFQGSDVDVSGQAFLNLQALASLNLKGLGNYGIASPYNTAGAAASLATTPPPNVPPIFPELNLLMPYAETPGNIPSPALSGSSSTTPLTAGFNRMQIRLKFGQLGMDQGQFSSPHGVCLGFEEDVIVADTNNHRVQVFDQNGYFKFMFGEFGKEDGQFWFPRKVAVLPSSGIIVVCDRGNARSRMQLFTGSGTFLKKISISYIDIVAGMAVNRRGNIILIDSVSPSVYELCTNGNVIAWFDCSGAVREPSDIAVYRDQYYICDFKSSSVSVYDETGNCLKRLGNDVLIPFPNGVDISESGEVLVGSSHGNTFRVTVFGSDGSLIGRYECPHIKVARCCGLKITKAGYIITLVRNSHHVLVFNTLYIL